MSKQRLPMDHLLLDERSLAMHTLAMRLMRADSARLARARSIVERWLVDIDPGARDALEAWQAVLAQGLEATEAVATSRSERATQLRQSSPVVCTLTPAERAAFLRDWRPPQKLDGSGPERPPAC